MMLYWQVREYLCQLMIENLSGSCFLSMAHLLVSAKRPVHRSLNNCYFILDFDKKTR